MTFRVVGGLIALLLAGVGGAVRASQPLQVVVERTELRWSETGRLLGHLDQGTTVERLGGRGGWTRVGVRGWMWSASLEGAGDEYEVGPDQENLRARPNGRILGQLVEGVEVRRVGGEGRWYEIELIGWLPDSALEEPAPEEAAAEEPAVEGPATEEPSAERPAGEEPAEVEPEPRPAESAPPTASVTRLSAATPLRVTPGGPVAASLPGDFVVQPVETRGGWTRVRIEGWVPSAAVRAGDDAASPAAVALDPESFRGRAVTWTLEHVAIQQADEWRSDFEPGEHYALTRVPGADSRYVYLVVPDTLVERFRSLSAFDTIRIQGWVRTGRSDLTGNPIVVVERLLP